VIGLDRRLIRRLNRAALGHSQADQAGGKTDPTGYCEGPGPAQPSADKKNDRRQQAEPARRKGQERHQTGKTAVDRIGKNGLQSGLEEPDFCLAYASKVVNDAGNQGRPVSGRWLVYFTAGSSEAEVHGDKDGKPQMLRREFPTQNHSEGERSEQRWSGDFAAESKARGHRQARRG
jgi:hypothetical protein